MKEPLDLLDWKRRVFELYAEIRRADDRWRPGSCGGARATGSSGRTLPRRFAPRPAAPSAASTTTHTMPGSASRPGSNVRAGDRGDPRQRRDAARVHAPRDRALRRRRARALLARGLRRGSLPTVRRHDERRGDLRGGRYLVDTVKGADLGVRDAELVLDFNFAYNPSCSYDDRWACPLPPPANRLKAAVRAGERTVRVFQTPVSAASRPEATASRSAS